MSGELEPTPGEIPYEILRSRQLQWGAKLLLINLYHEKETDDTLVVVQNLHDEDDYTVHRTPESFSPNVVFMSPWEFYHAE